MRGKNAMTTAVYSGQAIAIVVGTEGTTIPVRACSFSEFNEEMHVVLEDRGKPVIYKLSDLLPLGSS